MQGPLLKFPLSVLYKRTDETAKHQDPLPYECANNIRFEGYNSQPFGAPSGNSNVTIII